MNILERFLAEPDAEYTREELAEIRGLLMEQGRTQAEAARDREASVDDRREALEAAREASELLASVNERLSAFDEVDAEIEDAAAEVETAFAPDEVDEPVEEATEETEQEEVELEVEEPVAIAASRPSIGALARRVPQPDPEPQGLVASAGPSVSDVREFHTPAEIGAAALRVWNGYGRSAKVDAKAVVASFDTVSGLRYEVTGDQVHDEEVISSLLSDLREPDALVATGICAPAEPRYDYFGIGAFDGMIQLPTLNASRGAITYRQSPSFATVLANASWSAAVGQEYTNANAEAEASKANFRIECPSTTTCTVAAYPVILQFGNFTQRFDPETVANAIEVSMVYHDHFVNGQLIADMVAASTAVNGGDTGGGGLVNVANLVNFEATKYRDTYRMDMDARLTLVAPSWVRDALVADYVARNSTTDLANARGRVAALFASLLVDVQWVQDWQSIGDADDDGWRTAADFLLYAPGTFVRLDGGTLDLGIVRDSTLNATNEFQTFAESFQAVCEIGHDSWLLDDITICPRGTAAADATLDCNPGFGS